MSSGMKLVRQIVRSLQMALIWTAVLMVPLLLAGGSLRAKTGPSQGPIPSLALQTTSPAAVTAGDAFSTERGGFFLKLGTIAFGGPAAHIALMEDELVRRRKWIAATDFLDLLAVANILPGPSSTELAIFIGYRLRGLRGLFVAGTCFILPAFVMVACLAGGYVRFGKLPAIGGILWGVKPVVIAVVLQALVRLAKVALKTTELAILAALALIAMAMIQSPLLVLAGAAAAAAILFALRQRKPITPLAAWAAPTGVAAASAATAITLGGIFLVFLKIGSIVFGSGYVLLAYLQADLVAHRHWLTNAQLLDAVAVGQVTPGPVFTTATFIGYVLAGPGGATAATVAIFLPAFIFVALAGPLIRPLRRSRFVGAMLDGLNAASLGLMAFVLYQLTRSAIVDWPTLAIALACAAVLLLATSVNSVWLIAAGAALGLARALA